ncbi:MAG: SDR family oxidoreductase, partial [Hyphomicrobiaceae bacterium]
NYVGLVGFTRQFVDKLNPGGSIVNLASRAGNEWQANIEQVAALMSLSNPDELDTFMAAYDVDDVRAYHLSKEALIVWTMQQTQDLLGQELRMNCVSPAAVSTGILPEFKAAFGERATKGIALAGRAGSPQEIAELVAFLARPESSWIRGANIAIDGGLDAMLISEMLGLREA